MSRPTGPFGTERSTRVSCNGSCRNAGRERTSRRRSTAPRASRKGGRSGGSSIADIGDIGEGAVVLVVIALALLALAVLGAAVFLVWQAPVIFAEAGFQLVLASALARSSRKVETPGWTGSVFRATRIPVAIVLAVAVLAGVIAQWVFPEAQTVAEVIAAVRSRP